MGAGGFRAGPLAAANRWALGLAGAVLLSSAAHAWQGDDLRALASRFGLTAEQARDLLTRIDSQAAAIGRIAAANKIQRSTLRSVAIALGAESSRLSPEELLELIARRAADAAATQRRISQLDATIARLDPGGLRSRAIEVLGRAQALFDQGRLLEADTAFGELEFLRASDLASARTAWRDAVFAQAEIASLGGQNERASALYDRAARLLLERAAQAEQDAWSFQMANAGQWFDRGEIFGSRAALDRALSIYREKALPLAPRSRAPIDWASTQRRIGATLVQIATGGADPAGFEDAAAAFRLAEQVLTKDNAPLEWALLQSSLGGLYLRLIERDYQSRVASASAAAYESSLTVIGRENDSELWAATNDNLGNAYLLIGKEEGRLDHLGKAEAAYRKALEVRRRDQAPTKWALTQINLGAALAMIAGISGDPAPLEEAEAGLRAATSIFSPVRTPQWWAMARSNLGIVYRTRAVLGHDRADWKEAAEIFKSVLEVRTEQAVPFDWAQTCFNLADALFELGETESSIFYAREAQRVFTRAAAPRYWARLQHKVGVGQAILGQAASDPARLAEAIGTLEAALEVQTREQDAAQWTDGSVNIAAAEAALAALTGNRKLVRAAGKRAATARALAQQLGSSDLTELADEALAFIARVAARLDNR